jgi:hypothetical protein
MKVGDLVKRVGVNASKELGIIIQVEEDEAFGDLVRMSRNILGLGDGLLGVVINTESPIPQCLVSWNNGRQRWMDIVWLEVVNESR